MRSCIHTVFRTIWGAAGGGDWPLTVYPGQRNPRKAVPSWDRGYRARQCFSWVGVGLQVIPRDNWGDGGQPGAIENQGVQMNEGNLY